MNNNDTEEIEEILNDFQVVLDAFDLPSLTNKQSEKIGFVLSSRRKKNKTQSRENIAEIVDYSRLITNLNELFESASEPQLTEGQTQILLQSLPATLSAIDRFVRSNSV